MLTTKPSRSTASVVMALSVAALLAAQPTLAQDVIKVGAPLPLTGAVSPEGLKQKRGYDIWAEAANAKGGIKAGGKTYRVEIVYADYASNTPRAVQTAERMITEDKVQFLFAPFGSGATKAASADLREVQHPDACAVGIVAGNLRPGLQVHLLDADRQRDRVGADRQARDRKEQGHQARRRPGAQRPVPAGRRPGVREGGEGAGSRGGDVRALRHRHDGSFRRDHPDARRASRLGLRLRLHQRPDADPQADERSRPQGAGHHPDRRPGLPEFAKTVGPLAENITSMSWWHPAVRYKGKDVFGSTEAFNAAWEKKYGGEADYIEAGSAACGAILQMAIEKPRARSSRRRCATRSPRSMPRPSMVTSSSAAGGQINSLQPPVFQLVGGKPVVLWPDAIKSGEMRFLPK